MDMEYTLIHKNGRILCTWENPDTGHFLSRYFADENSAISFIAKIERDHAAEVAYLVNFAKSIRARPNITVQTLLREHNERAGLSQVSSEKSNRASIVRKLTAHLGRKRVLSLKSADLEGYLIAGRAAGLSDSTICRRLSVLRAACNWGADLGILPRNPLSNIKLAFRPSERIRPPNNDEARRILDHALPHVQRTILIGLSTGARVGPSELFRLRWSDVDFESRIINMPSAHKGHAEKSRPVPIREDLFPWLKLWFADDTELGIENVIHWQGKALRSIGTAWRMACRRAGIKRRIRPYDLRHAFATNALEAGADIGAVAAVMGHVSAEMALKTYQHVSMRLREHVVAQLPGIFPQCEVAGLRPSVRRRLLSCGVRIGITGV